MSGCEDNFNFRCFEMKIRYHVLGHCTAAASLRTFRGRALSKVVRPQYHCGPNCFSNSFFVLEVFGFVTGKFLTDIVVMGWL